MEESAKFLLISVILMGILSEAKSDAFTHRYEKGDPVPLYANTVGPFRNPSETYPYYCLPFCPTDHWEEKKGTFGEVLNGDRLVSAPYKLDFRVDRESQVLCRKNLTREEVSQFRTVIAQDYYLQMYYDDLPMWAFIGKIANGSPNGSRYFIYTKVHFEIYYNGDHIIEINLRTDPSFKTDLTEDKVIEVEFLYSVKWKETTAPFEERTLKYTHSAILPHHMSIHRSSISYSFWIVLILVGCLVALYVRVLRKDFNNDEELADNQEEAGWKVIHGDVFRYPKHKSFFVAAVGCGTQLFTVVLSIMTLGIMGVFRPYDRGVLRIALVFTYAVTNVISGFSAVSFYHQLEGSNWVWNLLLTGFLFGGPLFLACCFLNAVATIYGSTAALPLGTIVVIFLIWLFLAFPLLLLGGIVGKITKSKFQAPCRTTQCPREIPALRWYRGVLPQMAFAGLLPFSVIYIQLYYIFASVWGHRVYTLYGVLFICFILLVAMTALVSIGFTYLQLAAEDHLWWWRSFLHGGSTALYVYAYCFFYYFERADMSGLMQTSFLFGYMACICYGLFLLLGTVGFFASLLFVRYIYSSIKCD
ncbi:transmembrane 9 superfamily member 2-like [Coffea eugenioides]|uniref:transmembrane 9 superfamily member 2-like n=1 Tax=Coffea eugenioides TaxID=49369 RepID=UPI000F614E5E|nr:transmembrane 9 superfamily member 2-like [Coffea eugenioides]XP_027152937.1 transmembrane 9 superfamily member 2-like [Coffea eugenioides]